MEESNEDDFEEDEPIVSVDFVIFLNRKLKENDQVPVQKLLLLKSQENQKKLPILKMEKKRMMMMTMMMMKTNQ